MATHRLGFTKIYSTDNECYTYKVEILNEFENNYEVDYLYTIKQHEYPLSGKSSIIPKNKVFDIHTVKVSWFKRLWSGL